MSARDALTDRLGEGLHHMSSRWAEIEKLIIAVEAEAVADALREVADQADGYVTAQELRRIAAELAPRSE